MGKPTGFLEFPRREPEHRPVAVRLRDWREVYELQSDQVIAQQASRCMDCGIPFCTQGCPLGNRIPAFNDATYRERWDLAAVQLFATNNFPEFTGRLCPAPCESACVLSLNHAPVTIERVEYEVAEHAFANALPVHSAPTTESGWRVAIVGSGPAGLAAAAQLRAVGHGVTVFERADDVGGLLRYGIPAFKLEKAVLDRRLAVMRDAGVVFRPGALIGVEGTPLDVLRRDFDAVLLAVGATVARQLPVPGSDRAGVVAAMAYLEAANRAVADARPSTIDAKDQHVLILGGGDTGSDCLGTAHRQGAASVVQIEILERPPIERPPDQPWPTMARLYKTSTSQEEGGARLFATRTEAFLGGERVSGAVLRHLDSGEVESIPADLVLIAAGFTGPDLARLGLDEPRFQTDRSSILVDDRWRVSGFADDLVFACGDAVRGQSLIVWAIAEGRSAAAAIDSALRGVTTLPAPVSPYCATW